MGNYKTKYNIGDTIYYIPNGINKKENVYILKGNINKINIFNDKIVYSVSNFDLILNKTGRFVKYQKFGLVDELLINPENELIGNPLFFSSKDLCQNYIKRRLKRG